MRYIYIGALALTGIVVSLVVLRSLDAQPLDAPKPIQSQTTDYQSGMGGMKQSAGIADKAINENTDPSGNALPQSLRNPLLHLKRAELNETIARPLFAANRRPFHRKIRSRPPVRKRAPVRSVKTSYKLLGVIIGSKNSVALIRDLIKKENIRVSEGDEVEGWRISQVERHRVSLRKTGTKTLVLNLFSK